MTFDSAAYWEGRYANGGNSGAGSRGEHAAFKAAFLNAFVTDHHIRTVVELGCGDGYQLSLANYPKYVGFDVSPTAVRACREMFATDRRKWFFLSREMDEAPTARCDLALSLDVLFHLIEDPVYDSYLDDLFRVSRRWVILYTSDLDRGASNEGMAAHMRHRTVRADIAARFPNWRLWGDQPGLDGCDFVVYERHTHDT